MQPLLSLRLLHISVLLLISTIPCIQSTNEGDRAAQNSLFWGTYRPNLYFGTQTRSSDGDGLKTGMLWFSAGDFGGLKKIRHACEQGDNMKSYGWTKHDGRYFGKEEIDDSELKIKLNVEWVKDPLGDNGGDWAARVSGTGNSAGPISLIFYIGLEGQGHLNIDDSRSTIFINGTSPSLDAFGISVTHNSGSNGLNLPPMPNLPTDIDFTKFKILSAPVEAGSTWKAKDYFTSHMLAHVKQILGEETDTNKIPPPPYLFSMREKSQAHTNLIFIQKIVEPPFSFDISFLSGFNRNGRVGVQDVAEWSGKKLSNRITKAEAAFDTQFESTYKLKDRFSQSEVDFAKFAHGNLVGGIGSFYGKQLVDMAPYVSDAEDDDDDDTGLDDEVDYDQTSYKREMEKRKSKGGKDVRELGPNSLFTAVPSRPFFPRGFFWDEGFHQMLIGTWDNDLSLEIIKSWFDLLDKDGWVAREQILGEEARSKVPAEFQVQFPYHSNPPTLIMPVLAYLERLNRAQDLRLAFGETQYTALNDANFLRNRHLLDQKLAIAYLKELYPKLRLRYEWLRKTQAGDFKKFKRRTKSKEGYRWRGRVGSHTLTSGLDDYPRTMPPHVGELHVDLLCWMAWYADGLKRVAEFLVEGGLMEFAEDVAVFDEQATNMKVNLEKIHWDDDVKAFCDTTVNHFAKTVTECHIGYISLFPLALELLRPDSDKIPHILAIIKDPEHLWTEYGLRSLSKTDEYFNTNENYWRGPIWINLNWLTCRALFRYMNKEGPYQAELDSTYTELRSNLIQNMVKEYKRTGYIWEQYSAFDGQGQRSHPFTGWSSLVVSLMAEKY